MPATRAVPTARSAPTSSAIRLWPCGAACAPARRGLPPHLQARFAGGVDGAEIFRQRLWTDRCDDRGPFDIIGDVHGCTDELEALLRRLGYGVEPAERDGEASYRVIPPAGRKAVFVGDLVDRGPRITDTLRLVMAMVEDGAALCVLGNHEAQARPLAAGPRGQADPWPGSQRR